MRSSQLNFKQSSSRSWAFSLPEVVMATALSSMTVGGILYGYVMSATRAEWSAYSLAGQSLALQKLEQTRACKWDLETWPVVDQLLSVTFPQEVNILDIPINSTNAVYATNFTTISTVSTNPPLKSIRVDCVWRFKTGKIFTNTITTYRGPDT